MFPKLDFNCLKVQFPVTLKKIHIFERANDHLKIAATVLQYAKKHEECNTKIKKGNIFSEGFIHQIAEILIPLLYEPDRDPDVIRIFL